MLLVSAPSAPPQNISVAFISSFSIVLRWAPPEESSQNGIIRSYNVTLEGNSTRRNLISTTEGITIDSLEPFTPYAVSVAAHTVAIGPFSSSLQVTTLVDGKFI